MGALLIFDHVDGQKLAAQREAKASADARVAQLEKAKAEKCKAEVLTASASARKLIDSGKLDEAAATLSNCYDAIRRDEYFSLYREAMTKIDMARLAKTPQRAYRDRYAILDSLWTFTDDLPPALEKERLALRDRIATEDEQKRKAAKKREGVTIGMSKEEVLESSWGKPRRVNTDVYKSGTREQWVYGGGYLYFEGDVLTAIQVRN